MNNSDRNTRTLIVCFLVAVFALIPLRFIEAGQEQELMLQTQVLGEKIEQPMVVEEEVIFSGLEAPYDQLESCISQEEIEMMENEIFLSYQDENLSEEEVEVLLTEIGEKKNNICQ